MQATIIFFIASVALVHAGDLTKDSNRLSAELKKEKRGLLGLGYGSYSSGWDLGKSYFTYSALPLPYTTTTVVEKHVVPVEKPVPVAVKVPYAVAVDRPYPVHVPYAVNVHSEPSHSSWTVSDPVVVDNKYRAAVFNPYVSSW